MQIIHWLLKVAHDEARDNRSSSSSNDKTSSSPSKANNSSTQQQHVVLFKHCGSQRRRSRGAKKDSRFGGWQNFSSPFGILLGRKDVAKACFYSTLNLRRVGNSSSRRERRMMISMKMKKEELAACKKPDPSANNNNSTAAAHHVGNKVLPISSNEANAALPPRFPGECQKRDARQVKGDSNKTKAISRMKELIRWAAATKSDKNG
ncbi:unnamed protein product [Linum tenue]|uniref:Uncharacterized protein n=1 Tax=Linum tenue TaxID=586396 RepID=A0AAV0GPV5_9ROSI|nr:unnamed protein product [Linum tenue]